ncbi:MAG: flavodoxin [Ruminococcus callidus]
MQSRQTLFVRYCLYSYGGNTRQIAKLVQQETGGDLCEIEIATPYTGSYNDVVEQGQREVNSGFTPKLKPVSAELKNYDTVILGTPVWWYTYAPAMRTLLQSRTFPAK